MDSRKKDFSVPEYTQSITLVPQKSKDSKTTEFVKRSVGLTFKYFGAKLLSSILVGLGEWLVCKLIGIPGAVIYGIAACLGNLIPYVGPWFCGIGIGVACFIIKPVYALYALLALLALQMIEEFFLTPLIVGQALSVKPLLIVLITLIAGSLFGIWGILFAVPIAAIIKLGYQIYYQKKSFAEINEENKKR